MTIKIVTLEGCNRCANLKELFLKSGIKYHFSTCEEDPDNCDSLEALVNEIAYPMVLLSNSSGEVFEVLYITQSYEKLKEGKKIQGDITCIPYHSIDDITFYVKKKLNL